jgi:hypothetical protein
VRKDAGDYHYRRHFQEDVAEMSLRGPFGQSLTQLLQKHLVEVDHDLEIREYV